MCRHEPQAQFSWPSVCETLGNLVPFSVSSKPVVATAPNPSLGASSAILATR